MVGLFLCPDWGKQVKLPINTIRSDFKAYLKQRGILQDGDAYYAYSIHHGGNTAIAKTTIKEYCAGGAHANNHIYVGAYDETAKSWTVYELQQQLLDELTKGKAGKPAPERPNFNEASIAAWVESGRICTKK